jgi:tetratricopeptide (TPR) repeat protein
VACTGEPRFNDAGHGGGGGSCYVDWIQTNCGVVYGILNAGSGGSNASDVGGTIIFGPGVIQSSGSGFQSQYEFTLEEVTAEVVDGETLFERSFTWVIGRNDTPSTPSFLAPLLGLVPGRLSPGASGALQAAKQLARGRPIPQPAPTPFESPGMPSPNLSPKFLAEAPFMARVMKGMADFLSFFAGLGQHAAGGPITVSIPIVIINHAFTKRLRTSRLAEEFNWMDTQRFEHAIALRNSGQVEDSIRELQELATLTADAEEKATLVLNEARCLETLRRFKEAKRRIEDARRISNSSLVHSRADFGEASLYWHEAKREEALSKLDGLLKNYAQLLTTPQHRDLYDEAQFRRGILLTELGRYADAPAVLEECISFDLENSDKGSVLYNLGLCYLKTGELERAREKFIESLKNGAHNAYLVAAHYFLGLIYAKEGAHAKALQEFECCLPRSEEGQIPKENVYLWLATTARSLDLNDEAKRYEKLAKS